MNSKELNICFMLANYMCYPNGIEVGSASGQLRDIVKEITRGRKTIRKQVFVICEKYVSEGRFDQEAYGTYDREEVLKMIIEDYEKIFF